MNALLRHSTHGTIEGTIFTSQNHSHIEISLMHCSSFDSMPHPVGSEESNPSRHSSLHRRTLTLAMRVKSARENRSVRAESGQTTARSGAESTRSLKEFEKETDVLVREMIAEQQRELRLFERNWIYQHTDVIRKAETALAIRDVDERERVLRKETNMQEQYQIARRRLLAKQKQKLEQLYRERKAMKDEMQPEEQARSIAEKRISEIRRKAGIQVDPRFRHLREQPNTERGTVKRTNLGRLDPRRPRTTESTTTRRREVAVRPKPRANPNPERGKMIDSSKMFLVSKSKFNNVPQVVKRPKETKKQQFNIFDDDSLDRLFKERSARQREERLARERRFERNFEPEECPAYGIEEEEEEEHLESDPEQEQEPEPESEPEEEPQPEKVDLASSIRKKFELLKKAAEASDEEDTSSLPPDPTSSSSSPSKYSYTSHGYSDSDHIKFGYSSDSDGYHKKLVGKSLRRKL